MDQNKKKIKEQTVKSLEFEVEKLMKKHQIEMSEMKMSHKHELEDQEQSLRHQYKKSFDQYRVDVEREKKEMIEEEKILQLERFRKQAEQIQLFHSDEVSRLREEIDRERSKLQEESQRWVKEAEQIRQLARQKAEAQLHSMKEEMEDMKKALTRKHANELLTFKTNEESERKEFERKVKDNFENQWKEREEELRFKFGKERDLEIDRVIEKLEFEMKKAREEAEKSFETRMKRLRQKNELELAELVKEVEQLKEKLNQTRVKNMKTEENNHMMMSINNKLELKIVDLENIKQRLEEERKDITEIVRQEFCKTLDKLTEENIQLKEELKTSKITHKSEIHEKVQEQRMLRLEFEREIHGLQEKVEETVLRKDRTVEDIREQHELAVQRIHQLEALINQQSRDLISNQSRDIIKNQKDLINNATSSRAKQKTKSIQ